MKFTPLLRCSIWSCLFAALLLPAAGRAAEPTPVIFDTDIDDAYALIQILRSPELKLLGVTTVSSDALARLPRRGVAFPQRPEYRRIFHRPWFLIF